MMLFAGAEAFCGVYQNLLSGRPIRGISPSCIIKMDVNYELHVWFLLLFR
jgi:hypothetical protein